MGWGDFANAINGAINGTIGLGFGIYDRYKQNQQNALSEKQWNIARNDSLQAFSNTVQDMQSVGMSPLAMQGLNPVQSANQANGVVSGGMNDLFKGIGDDLSRKDRKAEVDMTHDYNIAKLDAEKAKAENEKVQAESNLAETIRHNKEEEKLRGTSINAINRISNYILDKIQGRIDGTAEGNNQNPNEHEFMSNDGKYEKKELGKEASIEAQAEAETMRILGIEVPKDHAGYDVEKDNPFSNGKYKKTDKKYKKEQEKKTKAKEEEDFKKALRPDAYKD